MAIVWTGGTGEKLDGIGLGPLAPGNWPQCDICHKPVDEVTECSLQADRDILQIIVRCHGEQEVVEVPKHVLVDMALGSLNIGGLAFTRKRIM